MNRQVLGGIMMALALLGAVATFVWLLWLSAGVEESWASRENIDKLPGYARQIGRAAAAGLVWTALALAGHVVAVGGNAGSRRDSP